MMTEQEWLECDRPVRMMRFLRREDGVRLNSWFSHPAYSTLPRKWRLFLAACCRRVWPLLGGGSSRAQRVIEYAEAFVERPPPEEARQRVQSWFDHGHCSLQRIRLLWGLTSPLGSAAGELRNLAGRHARKVTAAKADRQMAERAALDAEARAQCALIRDLFGYPPRPAQVAAAWLTPAVVQPAQTAYAERVLPGGYLNPARLAVVADALKEVGCTDADLLGHLRSPGSHVRGCWAIDLLLGKG